MEDRNIAGFHRILPLYIVIFIGFVGYSLMITILTPMILGDTGGILKSFPFETARTIVLGIVLALYPLGQFFGSPVIGALSDGFGRRPVLLVSLVATIVLYAVSAIALSIKSLPIFMTASFLAGISEANVVIAQSAIADVTPGSGRTRFFAYITLSASGAFLIGPILGGKLADPSIVSWFSYSTPYWFVTVMLALTWLLIYLAFRETRPPVTGTKVKYAEALTNLLTVFSSGRLRIIYLVNFLIYIAIFGFFRAFPMYIVESFGMGVSKVSNYIAWNAVPVVIGSLWIAGYLAKRYTAYRITIYSSVLFGVSMIAVVIPGAEWMLWVTLFTPGLALSVALPACASMLSQKAGAEQQGHVLGNNLSLEVAAEVLSGVAAGVVAALFIELPIIVFAVIVVVAAGVLYLFGDEREG
jgi:MFS family permease